MVGCGGMAGGHLAGYEEIKGKEPDKFEIVAVCDVKEKTAQDFAKRAAQFQEKAPKVYTKLDQMLKKEELDAADICTSHGYHHITAIPCLEAGLHIQIEKPFGITVQAGRKIMEAAEKHKRITATAENHQRYLGQRALHWAINDQKMIGDMRMFYAYKTTWPPRDVQSLPMQWRALRLEGGCGMVMDSGAHYINIIRYLFGEVDTVYAETRTWEKRTFTKPGSKKKMVADVEDSWMAVLRFESGLVGFWSFSEAVPGEPSASCMYYGSKGSFRDTYNDVFHSFLDGVELTPPDGKVITHDKLKEMFLLSVSGEEKDRLFPHGFEQGVTLECYDFVDAVQHNRKPEMDGWEGLKSKAINEAIYESAWCGEAVKVKDVFEGKTEGYQKEINERWGV